MRLAGPAAADTTGDGGWEPVTVTAVLAEPVVALEGNPLHLDGPAAWGAYLEWAGEHGRLSLPDPEATDSPADFTLPFATWTAPATGIPYPSALAADPAMTWGWACSRALYGPGGHSTVDVRKRPGTDPAARYARQRSWQLGAGPLKGRDVPFPATLVREIRWHALADPVPLRTLLERVHHVGRLGNQGNGRVLSWAVEPGGGRDAWRDRAFPADGGDPRCAVRAPYWHPSRKMPCSP